MTRMEITFQLDVAVKKDEEAGCFVAWCPTVDIYSAGNTDEEAKDAMESALVMFIKHCYMRNVLNDVLKNRGFQPDIAPPAEAYDLAEGTQQFIQVALQNFGGTRFPMQVKMPLSSTKDFECRV